MKSATPKEPRPRVMGWSVVAHLQLAVMSGGRALNVVCSPIPGSIEWSVVALEGAMPSSKSPSNDEVIESVMADHAHKNLGNVRGMHDAIAKAEAYAAEWQRQRDKAEDDRCACVEIKGDVA